MSFGILALIGTVALAGPLLAIPRGWRIPVVFGELVAGVALGPTGAGELHAGNTTFTFLADLGFALIMFVAGSHVPMRDPGLRSSLATGAARAVGIGVVSIPLAIAAALLFHTHHAPLYAVLIASSSAALILPIVDSLHLGGNEIRRLLPQVALADVACIVALPLVIQPSHAGRAALGALAIVGCSLALFFALRWLNRTGFRKKVHHLSEERKFALEMRINLAIVFALAALAVRTHVSIMLAGFSFGLVTAAIGEPRRLARQLFAVTEGFLGPLFFVWLGASLDLRELGDHPSFIVLGLFLGAGATVAHSAPRVVGQPISIGILASAQLGVPIAAATLGSQLHLFKPGEGAAIMLGAIVTIVASTAASTIQARRQSDAAAESTPGSKPAPA